MKKITTILVLLLAFCFVQAQTTYYVAETPRGNASGSSWDNASGDLQAMINKANTCDIVFVAEGTYYPNRRADNTAVITEGDRNNSFVLKKNVKIFGGFEGWESDTEERIFGAHESILSGDLNKNGTVDSGDSYHVVISAGDSDEVCENCDCLDGFTITGGNADYRRGKIRVNGEYVTHDVGGGIYITSSYPNLKNLKIESNYAEIGAGVYNENANSRFQNVIIRQNNAIDLAGGVYNTFYSNATFKNVAIYGNYADYGSGMANDNYSSPTLVNTTICYNSGVEDEGIFNSMYSSPQIKNSIIYGNSVINEQNSNPVYYNSLAQDITSADNNGNMDGTIDPMFKDPANRDFRLSICSPCINKGNNDFISGINTDLDYETRIFNNTVDIGAYESQTSDKLYVNHLITDGDGTTWNKAFENLTEALDFARENSCIREIWVAQGTYQPELNSFYKMVENVGIYGGFTGNEQLREERDFENNVTTLVGNGSSVVSNKFTANTQLSNSAILDGFTIKSGIGTPSTPQDGYRCGGGIYNEHASPTIENCIIENCSARWGGGVANLYSVSKYRNVIIRNNTASQDGGGVINIWNSYPEFEYVNIINNYVAPHSPGGNGGGIMNSGGSGIFTNCIIKGNTATSGGGLMSNRVNGYGEAKLINVEMTGNYARSNGGAIASYNGACYLYNSTISGNYSQYYGGGIANYGSRTTIASYTWIYNSIIWGNNSGYYSSYKNMYNPDISKIYSEYSLIEGCLPNGTWNTNMGTDNGNNIDANPYFIDYQNATSSGASTAGDFHIAGNSPAINRGLDAHNSTEYDLDGKDRILYGRIDMGAYEFEFPFYSSRFLSLDQENIEEQSLSIYPNPIAAGSMAYVEIYIPEEELINAKIQVYDILGKLVAETNVTGNITPINTPDNPGQYFIKIVTGNILSDVKKIIVN